MTPNELGDLCSAVEVAWPFRRPDGWQRLWMQSLVDLPSDAAVVALGRLVRSHTFAPSIAEVRLATADVLGVLPPMGADVGVRWCDHVLQARMRRAVAPDCPHSAVSAAVVAFGGMDAVLADEAGWRRWWAKQRALAVAAVVESDMSELLGLAAGTTRSELTG